VTRSRRGHFAVGRKTQRERLRKKWKALSVRLAALRTHGGRAMMDYVRRHLQGHIQYFGVSGNIRSVRCYIHRAERLLFKWLNRRSQRRSVRWERFSPVLQRSLPRARIVHNLYPDLPWLAQSGSRMV
jgi:RNA-directed DNA polymerase